MIDVLRNQEKNNQQLRDINNEQPVATLSLSISTTATVSLVTTGTLIPWDFELRNLLFTWSGTNITIPNDGMYNVSYFVRTNISLASMDGVTQITRSGVAYQAFKYRLTQTATNTAYVFSFMHYFLRNDLLAIQLIPSANCNLLQRTETVGGGGQSGLIHITQLTGAI